MNKRCDNDDHSKYQKYPITTNSKRIHKYHHAVAPPPLARRLMRLVFLTALLPVALLLANSDILVCQLPLEFVPTLLLELSLSRIYAVHWCF